MGASTCAAKCKTFAFSRNNEVTDIPVPAGTTTGAADAAHRIQFILLGHLLLRLPFEAGPVGPDAMQDDGDLARDATLAFLAPTRFISRRPHAFNADQRLVRCSKTLAAANK
jgi:hypothetical protein